MQLETCEEDKIQYISYQNIPTINISLEGALHNIQNNFQSKEWKKNFDALTQLRVLNKNLGEKFITKILRSFFKDISMQVDNLRSNNSKQALTLLHQILKYNVISSLEEEVFDVIVTKLFLKSCSEKGFLKNQARQAIKILPKVQHPLLFVSISRQTQSPNYQISELAILTLKQSLQKLMVSKQNYSMTEYLRILSKNIHGKRALIQKTSKQIIVIMQKSYSTEGLTQLIKNSNIGEEQIKTLLNEICLTKKSDQNNKGKGNLKDFIKQKKQQSQKMQLE